MSKPTTAASAALPADPITVLLTDLAERVARARRERVVPVGVIAEITVHPEAATARLILPAA